MLKTLLLVLAGTKTQKTNEIKGFDFLRYFHMLPIAYATVILGIFYFHSNRYRTAVRNLQTSFSVAIGVARAATARH